MVDQHTHYLHRQNHLKVTHHQLVGQVKLLDHPQKLIYLLSGLKSRLPERATAITISGEVTNAWVFGFPSALLAKVSVK